MNRTINKIRSLFCAPFILVACIMISACSDFLDTESDRVVFTDDNNLNTAKDSIYSIVGIYSLLQNLSDRYTILGELRGDLMDVTGNASTDLQDIANFEAKTDNPYISLRDYYSVINNCNYFIANIDTSIVVRGEKVELREYVVAKTVRAWVYYQMVLNYGKVKYIEEPITTVEDALQDDYPIYDIKQTLEILIKEIEPYINVPIPGYFSDFSYSMLFPIPVFLGDMHLWLGNYAEAATYYRNFLYDNGLIVSSKYQSSWSDVTFTRKTLKWQDIFDGSSSVVSSFAGDEIKTVIWSRGDDKSKIRSLIRPQGMYELSPSQRSISLWETQVYTYTGTTRTMEGDLRGLDASYTYYNDDVTMPYIRKSHIYDDGIPVVYRTATIYLRLAEALNRLHKPTTALAILNYGLNNANKTYIAPAELVNRPSYMNFDDSRFTGNIGTRQRGQGITVIALPAGVDTLSFVNACIRDEYALETAFEGNRFHDLMRMAVHSNNPAFLAEAVAAKSSGYAGLKDKLMNPNNWYLPMPE